MGLLVLLKGQPGSGKSTLGRALAAHLRVALVDKDDARDAFEDCASANPSIDWNALSYDVMFRYAETQLATGLGCIIDCPLARRSLFDRAAALAEKVGLFADLTLFMISVPYSSHSAIAARRSNRPGRGGGWR